MTTPKRTALLVLLFVALLAVLSGPVAPPAQAQTHVQLVEYAKFADDMNGDWLVCRFTLTNPGKDPFVVDQCIVDFLDGRGKKIAQAKEIWGPGFDLKATDATGATQMMGFSKSGSSGGGGPVKVDVAPPSDDPGPGPGDSSPAPSDGTGMEVRPSAVPESGNGKRVREQPERKRPERKRPEREKRGRDKKGADTAPPGTVPDGGGIGFLGAAAAAPAGPAGPSTYEPVGKKIEPRKLVIAPSTRSQDLWAYVLLKPPRKMGPGDFDVEIAAIDPDNMVLGKTKAIVPGGGVLPEGVIDPSKEISVYKIEPHKASKYLAVYFNLQNKSGKGYFVASIGCTFYGFNAQQPLGSGRIEGYEAAGFKQAGPLSNGNPIVAGSVGVNGGASVQLVLNGKARNGPLEVEPETVEGIKIEVNTTDGNTITSDRIVFRDVMAKLAGAKGPAKGTEPEEEEEPEPPEDKKPASKPPDKKPPDEKKPPKPPSKGDDDDDDDGK